MGCFFVGMSGVLHQIELLPRAFPVSSQSSYTVIVSDHPESAREKPTAL